jgi:hypothetical protein
LEDIKIEEAGINLNSLITAVLSTQINWSLLRPEVLEV